jgi:tRNA-2-methylthio-N6-dimethylallyladenosine synthase
VEVLVEGPSKTAQKRGATGPHQQLVGRTMCDRIVVFEGAERLIGRLAQITIYSANPFTLFGEVAIAHSGPEVYAISGLPVLAR